MKKILKTSFFVFSFLALFYSNAFAFLEFEQSKNISSVLDALGNPQQKSPTIHIAGTNGKGSTAAFCESILRNAGYRVGLYTSPHLINFSERIQVNRTPLSDDEVIRLAETLLQCRNPYNCPKGKPTFYEIPKREIENRFRRNL